MSHALAPVDAAWLHMDRATNRMAITAVIVVDDIIERAELVRLLNARLPHERFRQRVVEQGGLRRPRWVSVDVDFDAHIRVLSWPAPEDEHALEGVVGGLVSGTFDPGRPLWSLHVVTGARRCALVFRAHHCIGDGLALVGVLQRLTDEHVAVASVGIDAEARAASVRAKVGRGAVHALTLGKLLSLWPDPHGPWKQPLAPHKSTAWTAPVPLDVVKTVAHAVDAHVTDVLLACTAGALARARASTGRNVRALVPTFFRGSQEQLGNHFGLIYVALPLDIDDPRARLGDVRAQTKRLKGSADAAVALEILGALGRVSRRAESLGIALFSSKASAMITSVPGPASTVHILGRPVADIIALGPAAGSIALTAGLFSYRGTVRVAFAVDARTGVHARVLADAFAADFTALARAVAS